MIGSALTMLVCALVISAPGSTKRAVTRPANGARMVW